VKRFAAACALSLLPSCGRHDTPVASYFPAAVGGTDVGGSDAGVAGTDVGAAGGGGAAAVDAGGAAGEPGLVCPEAYTLALPGGTSRYRHVQTGSSWVLAERDCEREGQHLIVIDDAAENEWLASLANVAVTDARSTNQLMWLGAGDSRKEGEFAWVTGDAVSLAFWNQSEPEPNSLYDDEDCAEIRGSGEWNDDRCNVTLTYVCECDGQIAPEAWCDTSTNDSCGDCDTSCADGTSCIKQQCR
jgi:collectin sub-family protein 10